MARYECIIISDLHLGAYNSRGEDLLRFLDHVEANHLIINGDLFDRPHLGRLGVADLRVLEALRQYSLDRRLEIILGNHDPSQNYFRSVLGIDAKDETTLDVDARQYLVHHGHGWDRALTWPRWLVAGADGIYRASQAVDRSHQLSRFLKQRCKRLVKAVDHLRDCAIAEAKARGLRGVVLGHSHMSCDAVIDGVHYLNSGCWTENPGSFIGVRDGVVRQEYFVDSPEVFAFTPRPTRALSIPLPAPLQAGVRA